MRHARDILLGTRFELDLYVNYRPVRLLRRAAVPAEGPRSGRRQLRRLSREHRGRVRQRRRPLQGRAPTTRSRSRRRSTPTKACTGSSSMRSSTRRRNGLTQGLHGGQEQRDDRMGTRCGSGCSGSWPPQYPAVRGDAICTSTRWRMQMVKNPAQFEVIVTNNMFGDIVTDLGAQLQGGLGWRRPAICIRDGRRCSSRSTDRRRSTPGRTSPIRSARFCRRR